MYSGRFDFILYLEWIVTDQYFPINYQYKLLINKELSKKLRMKNNPFCNIQALLMISCKPTQIPLGSHVGLSANNIFNRWTENSRK